MHKTGSNVQCYELSSFVATVPTNVGRCQLDMTEWIISGEKIARKQGMRNLEATLERSYRMVNTELNVHSMKRRVLRAQLVWTSEVGVTGQKLCNRISLLNS